jgi:hypothetical protein
MSVKRLRRSAWIALLVIAGCDPNPNGPSAPSVTPDPSGKSPVPGKDPAKTIPLKQVGPPIGLIVPIPV